MEGNIIKTTDRDLLKEWKEEVFSEPSEEENASHENISNIMKSFKVALSEHIKKYPNRSRFYLEDDHGNFNLTENMYLINMSRHTRSEQEKIFNIRNEIRNLPENQGKPWQEIWTDEKQ